MGCRVILSSERDLKDAMLRKLLLRDMFTEMTVLPIYLPPLSKRTEDIPALSYSFLRRYAGRFDRLVKRIDERLLTRLIARNWSGNLDELSNCVERMVSVCEEETLTLEHYREVMETGDIIIPWNEKPPATAEELKEVKKRLRQAAVQEVERAFVTNALLRTDGNVTRAAHEAGMQRRNFQAMMREHGIKAG